jgi:CheY-like chemotaxis protein
MHSSVRYKKGEINDKAILVVEDDSEIGSFLLEALSLETSYTTILASDGFEALKASSIVPPCLCITDYRLPHMDGLELYDRLRAKEELADLPVILISAQLPEEEVKKRQIVGLNKPFELDDLLDTVEKLVG